jgi:hypothetical protein
MDVKPILEDSKNIVKAQQYIEFKWFVWKSHGKALVRFDTEEQALQALTSLQQYPTLDNAQVTASCTGKELLIDNLNSYTDELCIEEAMRGFGTVKEVEILKSPLKEISGEDLYLESLVKEIIARPAHAGEANNNYKMEAIEKGKNGLRVCRCHMFNLNLMNIIADDLNRTINKLGEGRLYAQTWFETPVALPQHCMTVYQ